MSTLAWLFVAFMAVWLGIGFYLVTINARQRKLEQRIADISGRKTPPTDSR